MSQVDLWAYERACWEEGAELVCGVDEACLLYTSDPSSDG